MDRINIKNLEVFAKHGIYLEERVLGQKFIISASLSIDLRRAGKSDELEDAVNYGEVCKAIKHYAEDNKFNLIETLAEGLAEIILIDNPSVKSVWVEVKKPWAPVTMHLETVSVEVERGRHVAYLSIGSNIGDREEYLRFAAKELGKARGCRVLRVSDFIETEPYGGVVQDNFLNGCIELDTLLAPMELLELLHAIEADAGRVRAEHWGPRTLDIDIILYDDLILASDELHIPHIDAHNREFVLKPLAEIAPYARHPVLHKTVAELLEMLNTRKGL
ncbi:MAG: 2-amino-4-hydroxy-6-hydroxymethyldihydropteridine diphosphokinase [Oscillospiraceae bacterium]|nr:2-amino-4-hydroxy-6-hydroxymethyldihydropteridine diphosphokinase [Oscillospiraceae bacterium]